jgi:quinol monooxygenase YgiN
MRNQTMQVVARVVALPGHVEALRAVLLELIEPTRKEPGCIQYDLLQNLSDPTDFTFVEKWASNGALDAHLASPHIQAAVAKLDVLVAVGPDIRRYRLVA